MKKITSLLTALTAGLFALGASAQTVATTPTAAAELADGYYVIKAKYQNTSSNVDGYVYHDTSNSSRPFQFKSEDAPTGSDLKYVWYLHKFGNDGGFTLQNASTGGFFPSNDGHGDNFKSSTAIANAAILKYNTYEAVDGSLESGVTLYEDNYTNKYNIHANAPSGYYNLSYWENGEVGKGSLVQFAFYAVSDLESPTVEPTKESYALTYTLKDGETTLANVGSVKTADELTGTAEVPSAFASSLTLSYYYTLAISEETTISTSNHNFTVTPTKGNAPFTFTTETSATWYNVSFGSSSSNYLVKSGSTLWANQSAPATYSNYAQNGAWAVEESGYGVKIKNRGTGKYISVADGNNQTKAALADEGTTFIVTQNESGYSLSVPGYSTNGCGNHISGELGVWNNTDATSGDNSRWMFTALTVDNAKNMLTSELVALNTSDASDDNVFVIKYSGVTEAQSSTTSAATLDDLDKALAKVTVSTPDAGAYYQIYTGNCTNGYISSSNIDVDTNGSLTASNTRVINRATADEALVPQLWQFAANGDGTYKIRNANTGCFIGQAVTSGTGIEMPVSDAGAGTFTLQQGAGEGKSSKVMLLESGHIINAYGGNYQSIISEYANATDGGGQWTIKKVTTVPVTISAAAGYASVALPFAVQKPTDEGVKVYYASSVVPGAVKLEEITADVIPAKTGFLLAKDGGATVNLTIATAEGSAVEGNHLVGTTAKRSGFEVDATYVLALNSSNRAAFLQSSLTTVPANKAYIPASDVTSEDNSAPAAVLNFDLNGKTTGITSAATTDAAAPVYYDLSGRRVLYPAKGIFVNDRGEKVLLK